MTPEQMRARADENAEWAQVAFGLPNREQDARELLLNADLFRAAADQLEVVRRMLQTTDPGNPYIYDPWSDESVDPTNMDEVVRAAVSAGWSKGAYELTKSIREALEGEVSDD